MGQTKKRQDNDKKRDAAVAPDPDRRSRGGRAATVYETLHREILTLVLAPGAPLDETQLASRFKMSRSPIREALNRLAAQNLVVMLTNRSTLVAPLDLSAFPRYVEALDLLQRINTRLAAERRTAEDVVTMRALASKFDDSLVDEIQLEMSSTNKAFHMAIADAGRNPYLARQYETLLDEGRRLLHLHFDYLAQSNKDYILQGEHHEMVDAIEAHDLDEADRLAHAHTRLFHDRFMEFLSAQSKSRFSLDPDQIGNGYPYND